MRKAILITLVLAMALFALNMTAPTSGVFAGNPGLGSIDSDHDGCSDQEELGTDPKLGGLRDPYNPWDFLDFRGVIPGSPPDGQINIFDIMLFAYAYGSKPGDLMYSERLDRRGGNGLYNLGPPDGEINAVELQAVFGQLGNKCQGPTVDSSSLCDINRENAKASGVTDYQCTQTTSTNGDVNLTDYIAVNEPPLPPVGAGGSAGASEETKLWHLDGVQNGKPYGHMAAISVSSYIVGNDPPPGEPEPIRTKTCRIEMKDEVEWSFLWMSGTVVFEDLWLEVTYQYYSPWSAILADSVVGHTYSDLEDPNWQWVNSGWPNVARAHTEAKFAIRSPFAVYTFSEHLNQLEIRFDGGGGCSPWYDGDYWTIIICSPGMGCEL